MTWGSVADDEASREPALARRAREALQSWWATVENIPRWAHDARRSEALEEIVRWYERVFADPACVDPAPLAGLDALTDELTEARSHDGLGRLARARWAVQVAEELVNWRASQTVASGATAISPTVAPAMARIADSRLELALNGARRQWQPYDELSADFWFEPSP